MAEASLNSRGETPVKSSGCLFCGTQQTDSRTRASLKGKVQDVAERSNHCFGHFPHSEVCLLDLGRQTSDWWKLTMSRS